MYIRHKFILHVQRVFLHALMSLIRSTGSRMVVPSSSAYTFEQNVSNLNCLPTHYSIANIFYILLTLDVVSLEESKGLGDELSSFTCLILNNRGDASHVVQKTCNLRALYCIMRLTYRQSLSGTMVFVFRIDTKEEQRLKLEGEHLWVCCN